MKWYELENEQAKQAHARLSVELPVHFHSPLKISRPLEDDDRDEIKTWEPRGVWDV